MEWQKLLVYNQHFLLHFTPNNEVKQIMYKVIMAYCHDVKSLAFAKQNCFCQSLHSNV